MKPDKNTILFYLSQFLCIIITAAICFAIYRWGSDNDKACFALTLGALSFLILCFYSIVFNGNCKGMAVCVLSGLTVIIFANKLYDYEKLTALFPILSHVSPELFTIIVLGTTLLVLLLAKLLIFIYNNAEENVYSASPNGTSVLNETDNVNGKSSKSDRAGSGSDGNTIQSKAWMLLCFTFLIILVGAGCALFGFLNKIGVLKQNYDFSEIMASLLKYAGSVVMILLEIVIVIIFMIEMIRLIVSRMRAFARSLKSNAKTDTMPLYALSAVLDIVVCCLAYKFTGVTIDSFYNFVNSSEYLALPLLVLFIGIAFVIFLRLTHLRCKIRGSKKCIRVSPDKGHKKWPCFTRPNFF